MINLMIKCFIKFRKKKLWDEVLVKVAKVAHSNSNSKANVKSIVGGVPTTDDTFVNTFVDVNDFVSVDL